MKTLPFWSLGLGLCLLAGAASRAEEVTVTTYYPDAHGVYEELESAGVAELAIWGGKVGVGLGQPRGGVDVLANAAVTESVTVGNVSVAAGPTWRLSNSGGRFVLSATQGLGGGTPLETLTVIRPDGYVGIGNFNAGLPRDHLDVKGGMVIGNGLAGEASAGTGDLMVEGRVGLGLNPGQLPQNRLDVAGAAVIGNGFAGTKTIGAADSLAVQARMGVGTSTIAAPTRLAVAGPAVIGSSLTGNAAPGGADVAVSGTMMTPSKIVVSEGSLSGAPRVQYGLLSAGRYGGEVRGSGTAAGAESDGSAERLFVDGAGGRIFEASTAGTVTVKDTLQVDTNAKTATIPVGAKLRVPDGASNDFVLISNGSGKGTWTDPATIPALKGAPGAPVTQATTPAIVGSYVFYSGGVPACRPDLAWGAGTGCSCAAGTSAMGGGGFWDSTWHTGPGDPTCPPHPQDPTNPNIGRCWVSITFCVGW